MKRYQKSSSYVPWLMRNSKFLHELEKDSVDSEIIDDELRAAHLDDEPTTCVHVHVHTLSQKGAIRNL